MTRTATILPVLEWILAATCVGFLLLHTLPRAWKTLNTDFPNYYLTAQLARDGADTSRAYEWRWLQRQKDHTDIDQRVVGLVPITPFSTLFVWPLSYLAPLTAKHIWLTFNLMLLVPIAVALRSMTNQPLRRIIVFIAACLPLHHNLLFGQYYILLLALLCLACWTYIQGRFAIAGTLIALATALKIFPVLFVLYFVRKRNWTALLATGVGLLAASLISVWVFGWAMHRTYLSTILPWTLRGEALPPYMLASSSISTLLHRLFIFEPQWNPRPWINQPALYAILQPLLQTIVLAPAILLTRPHVTSRQRTCLEWSALITATLAISTVPASYNFTLMIFPALVLCGVLLRRRPWIAALAATIYLAIGYPGWNTASVQGLHALLHVPRLYLLLIFTAIAYCMLGFRVFRKPSDKINGAAWSIAFIALTVVSIHSNLKRDRNLYADYKYRIQENPDRLMSSNPAPLGSSIASVALVSDGYHFFPSVVSPTALNHSLDKTDELSFASGGEQLWIEESDTVSQFTASEAATVSSTLQIIRNAHSPVLALDHDRISYLRSYLGRDRLFERSTVNSASVKETAITPATLNVEEATLLADSSTIVSALSKSGTSSLYRIQNHAAIRMGDLGEARYPAASPDGRWLAYSRFTSGTWNLWLADLQTDAVRRLADVPCNQIEPAWLDDSKTLLYASDCGRALWFTAICKRKIIDP